MRPTRYLRLMFAALVLPLGLQAQRVYWNPDGGSMGLGKSNELNLVFEDCAPSGDVSLPSIDGVDFGRPSVSSQTSIVNFKSSRRTVMTYPVQPLAVQRSFTIPTFSVATDKGRMTVPGVGFDVGQAAVGQTGLSIADIVESQITVSRNTVWVGEVIEVEYLLIASTRYQTGLAGEPDWKPAAVIPESFGEAERIEATVRGERRPGLRYRTRFIATAPGRVVIDPVRQRVTVQTGERTSLFFSQPRIEEFVITSNQPELIVKALPSPSPSGFSGAVGTFALESKIVPEKVRVGDPITWTLSLSGVGNWTSNLRLPEREVSADFEVVQPKTRSETDAGKLFSGSLVEDAVLVPMKQGTYALGPVRFVHFDTAKGEFVTREIAARSVTIDPAPPPRGPGGPASGSGAESAFPSSESEPGEQPLARSLPDALSAPRALPRDPLTQTGTGFAPQEFSPLWWFFIAFIPPLFTWVGLAWREALRNDLARERRAARRSLIKLLSGAPASNNQSLVREWRRLVIRMWSIDRAAPTVDDLEAAFARVRASSASQEWKTLWSEAESYLYGQGVELPVDWQTRARALARSTRIRRASLGIPHRLRHWTPALGALALVLAGVSMAPSSHAAASPEQAYREGRVSEARNTWLARVATHPGDWVARNNLALTYAQDNQWADAAAHWTAAFLLQPREESIRRNLHLALSNLDGVDPGVRRLVAPSWHERPLFALAPAEWQALFFAGSLIAAVGMMLWVLALYRHRDSRLRTGGLVLGVVGVVLSTSGLLAERLYGSLAKPSVGLVTTATELRSIPTDLAERQQTAPVSPGTVVVVRDAFIGWSQVAVGDVTVGWIRRETITPLYLPPTRPGPKQVPSDPASQTSI